MVEVYVNDIIEYDNGSKMGVVASNDIIIEDMKIIYDDKLQRGIQNLIKNPPHPEGFHIFSRFHQLIVLFLWDTKIGASLSLSDHNNNIDNALDEYLALADKDWTLDDRNTIMKIFEEVRTDNSAERAKMIIR